jgi:hypothetical protein
MLDSPDVMVAVPIDQGDELQRLLPIITGGFHVWSNVGKELNADPHDPPSAMEIYPEVLTARRPWLNPCRDRPQGNCLNRKSAGAFRPEPQTKRALPSWTSRQGR